MLSHCLEPIGETEDGKHCSLKVKWIIEHIIILLLTWISYILSSFFIRVSYKKLFATLNTHQNNPAHFCRIEECSTYQVCSHGRFLLKWGKSVTGIFWLFSWFYRKSPEGISFTYLSWVHCHFDILQIVKLMITHFISGQWWQGRWWWQLWRCRRLW